MKRLGERSTKVAKVSTENKGVQTIYVIRRSIYLIFIFFSVLIMIVNCCLLTMGLCFNRLLLVIDEGARPVPLINFSIVSEIGATISVDAIAQAQNDLLIAKGFSESILAAYLSKRNLQQENSRLDASTESSEDSEAELEKFSNSDILSGNQT